MAPFLFRAILTVSLMISSAEAVAQTPMIGLGGQRCGAWTADNSATGGGGVGLLYQQWIFGFLSGVSYADQAHDPLKGMDTPTVMNWLDNYCQDNSAERLMDAAIAFARAHGTAAAR